MPKKRPAGSVGCVTFLGKYNQERADLSAVLILGMQQTAVVLQL